VFSGSSGGGLWAGSSDEDEGSSGELWKSSGSGGGLWK
jgi:hypothetical protein